ncbi:globin-like [Harmonia axyridis]|uniref:globin-like n=1 Tax=Harmonia axyridis TaxID=115357 RepID=UPI001E2779CD|nr:globin-like [Harmonia axyridis]
MKVLTTILLSTVLTKHPALGGYWYFGEDQIDPLTGMTDSEKGSIRSSWKYMMKDPIKYGSMILQNFFQKHPEYLEFFPFKDVTIEELTSNKKFLVYLNFMMYTLDAIVDNLRLDPAVMKAILRKLGVNHLKSNVGVVEPFWDLRDMILDYIRPLVNRNTYEAWAKFSNMTMHHITSAIVDEQNAFEQGKRDLR